MIGEIIDSFTKNHYFLKKCNLGSPFQHDATICDKSVCNVKLPQNYGLSDEVCLNSLYRPIHILFEPNVEYLVKKLHFARVFWLFGLPNFIHWPCNAQIWIPHEILHWDSAPHVTLALKEMSLEHGKEILAELRYCMFLGWQFVDPAH